MQPEGYARLLLVLVMCLLVACTTETSSSSPESGPAADLHAAASATLALQSFHVESTARHPPWTASIDYVAPDREIERFPGNGEQAHETITIGDTVYLTAPRHQDNFWEIACPGSGISPVILGYIKMITDKAEGVAFDGHVYTFDLPAVADGAKGEATVSNGLLGTTTLHLPVGSASVVPSLTFTYSGFNSDITIEAPPADRIVKAPNPSPCPSPSAATP